MMIATFYNKASMKEKFGHLDIFSNKGDNLNFTSVYHCCCLAILASGTICGNCYRFVKSIHFAFTAL